MKWKMKKLQAKAAEIMIYGDISTYDSWWDDSAVTPQKFNDELKALGDDITDISVRINSNGGDVFAGVAIHSMLKRHSAKVTVYIDGIAASIASVIAMAGDEIVMPVGSMLMIHNPWTIAWGNAADFRKLADDLDVIAASMIDVYEARTGVDRADLTAMLDKETWLNATDAVAKGFATRVEQDTQPVAASLRGKTAIINGIEMDLSRFKNLPKLPEEKPADEPGDIEALRREIRALTAQITAQAQTAPPPAPTEQQTPVVVDTGRFDLEIKRLALLDHTI